MIKPSRRLIVVLAICVLLPGIIFGLRTWNEYNKIPKPPIILPVSLEKAGSKTETYLRIVDHHVYYFSLRFSFMENNQVDRARVRSLTGGHEKDKSGKARQPGVPTPVILRVSTLEAGQEHEIYVKEIDPILTSWGADHFRKVIGFTELKPGLYKVQLENLRSSPEFNETPVALGIGYDQFKTFIPIEK